jgi:AraC-like DNA-binding protein
LNHAKLLVANPDVPLKSVPPAIGISTQSAFSRFFKHHTGMNPLQDRKQHQAGMQPPSGYQWDGDAAVAAR